MIRLGCRALSFLVLVATIAVVSVHSDVPAAPVPAGPGENQIVFPVRSFDGHKDGVWAVAFSPDGKRALSASYDRSLRLWDVASGKELMQIVGHDGPVLGVAFLKDGSGCVSCSADGTVRVWNLSDGKERLKLKSHQGAVNSLSLSPDGKTLVTGGADGLVKLWDVASGKELRTLEGATDWIWCVAFSPSGKQVLAGGADKLIRLWDVSTGKELQRLAGHQQAVTSLAFLNDGRRAVSGSSDESVRVWNLDNGQSLRRIAGHRGPIYAVAFSPQGQEIFSAGADGVIHVWDTAEAGPGYVGGNMQAFDPSMGPMRNARSTEKRRLEGHDGAVYALCLTPDGTSLLSGGRDSSIKLFALKRVESAELHRLEGAGGFVRSVAFAPDGNQAATAGADALSLWDANKGILLKKFDVPRQGPVRSARPGPISGLVFLPDGKRLVTRYSRNELKLWTPTATGNPLKTIAQPDEDSLLSCFAVTPDGKRVLTGSINTKVQIWDVESGKKLGVFDGHQRPVGKIVILPSGREAISASSTSRGGEFPDETVVRRWDLGTLKESQTYDTGNLAIAGLAISPSGRGLLAYTQGSVVVADQNVPATLFRWWSLSGPAQSINFSLPGGPFTSLVWVSNDQFVTGGRDGVLRLWDFATKQQLQEIGKHQGQILDLAFAPAKRLLLSAASDQTARIWKLPSPGSVPQPGILGIFGGQAPPPPVPAPAFAPAPAVLKAKRK